MLAIEATGLSEIFCNDRSLDVNKNPHYTITSTKINAILTLNTLPFQPTSNVIPCMSHHGDLVDTLLDSTDDEMSQRPRTSKQPPKASASQQRTRAQAQASGSGSGTTSEAEKRKAGEVPMDDDVSAPKMPSLREQLT